MLIMKVLEIYVYIHVKDDKVIYCGKGTRRIKYYKHGNGKYYKSEYDRAYKNNSRKYYKVQDVEVFKVAYFDTEDEAFKYEEFLTRWYKACGQCEYNEDIANNWGDSHKNSVVDNHRGRKNPWYRADVYCPELDMTFEGSGDASRKCLKLFGIKVSSSVIRRCCRGERKSAGKYLGVKLTWEYLD